MSDQQATGSAWPDPPYWYKRYTTENLEKLAQAKKTGTFPETPISQTPPLPDFYLQSLDPPPPPTDSYTVFDQRWQVNEHLQTLSDMGVKQLFPSGPIDRAQELKKLNRALIVQFLSLLDVLVKDPEQYGQRIENISTIFINMHHILNEYRPHQARETLKLLMEHQVARKRQMAEEIRKKSKETLKMLAAFGHEIADPLLNSSSKEPSVSDTVATGSSPEKTIRQDRDGQEEDISMEDVSVVGEDEKKLHENLVAIIDNIE